MAEETDKVVIAKEALFTEDGVRAHNEGDEVPAANVGPNGWADKVGAPKRVKAEPTA